MIFGRAAAQRLGSGSGVASARRAGQAAVRRSSLVASPGLPAESARLPEAAAESLIDARKFVHAPKTRGLAIVSMTSSQAVAIAFASFMKHGKSDDFLIFGFARNPEKARSITIMADGKPVKLADLPGLKILPTDSKWNLPPDTPVLITLASHLAMGVLDWIPKDVRKVLTFNGLAPLILLKIEKEFNAEHGVSMFTTSFKGLQLVFGGGKLLIDRKSPVLPALQRVVDGEHLSIVPVENVLHEQWNKIALNTVLNTLATIFRKTIGELHQHMLEDPRLQKLADGVIEEVRQVAVHEGAIVFPDTVRGNIKGLAVGAKTARHPTSMGVAFEAGDELEVPVLSGGMNNRAPGVEAPLCAMITEAVLALEAMRDSGAGGKKGAPVPEDFNEKNSAGLRQLWDALLQHAATLPDKSRPG